MDNWQEEDRARRQALEEQERRVSQLVDEDLRKEISDLLAEIHQEFASLVQDDLFSDFFAYRSMAKDVDASEETFVAPSLLPL